MEKRKVSISLGTVILCVILLIIFYVAFDILSPIIITFFQDKPDVLSMFESKNKTSEVIAQKEEYISYEDKKQFIKSFPNFKFRAKVYYDIYGKKVLEDDNVLDLSDITVDEKLSDYLALLPNIKEINISEQKYTKDQMILLQKTYPDKRFTWTVEILGENVKCDIEELDFSNRKIADLEDFKKSLSLLPNLKKLDMSNTNLTNEQLGALREQFPKVRIDWVVHLGKWSLRTDAVAFSVLIVQYDYKRMTSEDIQVLKYCTELQALDLGHQAIEDISVIGEYLPNLRVLILADNKIKDISPIAKLKHLHYLELFMNNITDSTPLASCKELVDVNISFNYHFSNVDGIMDLPLLERLWLISDNISAESYKKIRERYPNVNMVTTGSGSTNSGWRTHERYFAMIDMYRNNYISDSFLKYDNK